ncbi:MAG TPA: hypothetical protein VIZ65_08660 [Cellvibrionaceae bacterium]
MFTPPPDPHLIFTGRGAASGPMLMSAMGPAGIAVGLAIDVGIGKDIERFGFAEGLKVNDLFFAAINTISAQPKLARGFFTVKQLPNFQLNKIGFTELPGQDNKIIPAIELTVQRTDWQKTYHYPQDFRTDASELLPSATLEELKSSHSPAQKLLQQALTTVIQKSMADWQSSSKN